MHLEHLQEEQLADISTLAHWDPPHKFGSDLQIYVVCGTLLKPQ